MRRLLFSILLTLILFSGCSTDSGPIYYTLTTTVIPAESGTISPSTGEYNDGTTVELKATANDQWVFDKWEGDLSGNVNPTTVTIQGDTEITAHFIAVDDVFEGGNGTESHPFQVSTLDQLQAVKEYPASFFLQVNDIDAGETEQWNDGKGFVPIGDIRRRFSGTYDGAGYEISGLTIDRPFEEFVGLFGYVEEGRIEHVQLVNIDITGSYWAGGLVGLIDFGTVHHSHVTGRVSSQGYMVGGLAGSNQDGEITNSSAGVDVLGDIQVGGLVGVNVRGDISRSFATGTVSGNQAVGGLVGGNGGYIRNSFATGSITGEESIGGLIGNHAGVDGLVVNSYSTGAVTGNEETGGFIGSNHVDIESSYWDRESSGQNSGVGEGDSAGATGLTTSQMTGSTAETNMPDFDWETVWRTSAGYPELRWQEE